MIEVFQRYVQMTTNFKKNSYGATLLLLEGKIKIKKESLLSWESSIDEMFVNICGGNVIWQTLNLGSL